MVREAERAEKALKALVKEANNKRCINCDSLGPQYVVSNFNVFVCTVCSGVHRQFGHRVKGVSMSTFKPDEVAVLQGSGNGKFQAFFLSKWQTSALPKPVDRDVHRIHAWIQAVYQDRRFYAEPAGGYSPSTGTAAVAGSTTSEGKEVSLRPLSEVLGSDTPKLSVHGSVSASGLERSVSAASKASSTGAGAGTATPAGHAAAAGANGATAAGRGPNLMDVASPKAAHAQSAPPDALPAVPAAGSAWDPFGDRPPAPSAANGSPAAAAAAAAASGSGPGSARAASAPADAWRAFGDLPAAPGSQPQPPSPAAAARAAPAVKAPAAASGGWEAFGDGPAAESAAAAAPAAAPTAPASSTGTASSATSSPAKPQPRQPVRSSSRPEVSMDIFYPEFEQIRATGILPTGQPVPLHTFPASYAASAAGGQGYRPHSQQHQQHPPPAAANTNANPFGQQQTAYGGGGYGAARPSIAIPPAPQHPGGGYGYGGGMSPSPTPGRGGNMHSPGYSAGSSGYHSPGMPSPAGSGFSSAQTQHANGGGGYTSQMYASVDSANALRSSASSLSDLMPGSAAPTPAAGAGPAHRLGDRTTAFNDPFAGLAPGLRSALPQLPDNGSGSSRYGPPSGGMPGAPPPTPAGYSPFHAAPNGAAAPAAPYAAGRYAGAPTSGPGLAPATAAASATLFGRTPSLTGYDMSAPAAPQPQSSGNPFA